MGWVQFNEGKGYGDLYHGFGNSRYTDRQLSETLSSILEQGLRFTPADSEGDGHQPIPGWYKGGDGGDLYRNITGGYFISTSRNPNWYKQGKVTLVLDGGSISERYRIHPFQLNAGVRIKSGRRAKENPGIFNAKTYMSMTGKRPGVYEEKIESKRPGFLDPKYIKAVILYRPSDELVAMVREAVPEGFEVRVEN